MVAINKNKMNEPTYFNSLFIIFFTDSDCQFIFLTPAVAKSKKIPTKKSAMFV